MLIPLAQRISRAVEKYPEKTDRQIVRAWINEPEKLSGRIVTEWCGFKEEQKP